MARTNASSSDTGWLASYLVADCSHPLVNIPTNGKKILCAVLNEKNNTWQIRHVSVFRGRSKPRSAVPPGLGPSTDNTHKLFRAP